MVALLRGQSCNSVGAQGGKDWLDLTRQAAHAAREAGRHVARLPGKDLARSRRIVPETLPATRQAQRRSDAPRSTQGLRQRIRQGRWMR